MDSSWLVKLMQISEKEKNFLMKKKQKQMPAFNFKKLVATYLIFSKFIPVFPKKLLLKMYKKTLVYI